MSVEAAHTRGLDSVLTLQQSARNFEAKLKTERWTKDSPEWIQASKSSCEQAYDKAIDKLESLVVARVFELSKMNHAGTGQLNSILLSRYESKILNIGYKLRKHIANNLKRRSQAVKMAVKEYNLAAANFDSSIKEIDAKEVLEYVYIGQFDILRCSRRQITAKPWSRPAEREALISFFRLQRAREEIVRLEVEMRRLTTYMRDFKLHAERISSTLEEDNRLLAHQFKKRFRL